MMHRRALLRALASIILHVRLRKRPERASRSARSLDTARAYQSTSFSAAVCTSECGTSILCLFELGNASVSRTCVCMFDMHRLKSREAVESKLYLPYREALYGVRPSRTFAT